MYNFYHKDYDSTFKCISHVFYAYNFYGFYFVLNGKNILQYQYYIKGIFIKNVFTNFDLSVYLELFVFTLNIN